MPIRLSVTSSRISYKVYQLILNIQIFVNGVLQMALNHSLKLLDFELDGKKFDVCESDTVVSYLPNQKKLNISLYYYSGKIKSGLFFSSKEKIQISLGLEHHEYTIDLLIQGDEQTTQVKNMGGGALLGAVVAGPLGAAAGAYFGSRLKECPCKIKINEPKLIIKCLAPIGFVKEMQKLDFLKN